VAEPARQKYRFEDYLALEAVSPVKHEFLEGHVWAMAGGTPEHAAIAVNVSTLLNVALRGRPCRVYSSDLRVRVMPTGLGTYPDVTVVCGQAEFDPQDSSRHTITNPLVVVEVLSPSTEDYDRGEKLEHYQQMPSLSQIVLVSHSERRVEVWERQAATWKRQVVTEGEARLEALGCSLPIGEVYRDPLIPG
jgi:Uma2 family endonuclease